MSLIVDILYPSCCGKFSRTLGSDKTNLSTPQKCEGIVIELENNLPMKSNIFYHLELPFFKKKLPFAQPVLLFSYFINSF